MFTNRPKLNYQWQLQWLTVRINGTLFWNWPSTDLESGRINSCDNESNDTGQRWQLASNSKGLPVACGFLSIVCGLPHLGLPRFEISGHYQSRYLPFRCPSDTEQLFLQAASIVFVFNMILFANFLFWRFNRMLSIEAYGSHSRVVCLPSIFHTVLVQGCFAF